MLNNILQRCEVSRSDYLPSYRGGFDLQFNEIFRMLPSGIVKNLAKAKISGKRGNEFDQLKKNPQQMMKKMQGAIDPSMLQKLGGMDNVMNMMKEMGKMEGMGDLMKQITGLGGSKKR